jgi:anti-sigma regulatory factor (Ser/Thr protein kinase)
MTVAAHPAPTVERRAGFRHEALLYDGADGLTQALTPWVTAGVAAGDPVVALVTARSADALRSSLGSAARHVHVADMGEVGGNPTRIISLWHRLAAEHSRPGHDLRAIGEPVWPGRSADELVECRHHEALINAAFADIDDLWLVCPYDAGALSPEVLAVVGHSHPVVEGATGRAACPDYAGSPTAVPGEALPEPPDAAEVTEMAFDADALPALRERVRARAAVARLSPRQARDLVLAVSEVATNSVLHGGGHGRLRAWVQGRSLVHEVSDAGHITDALAGRRLPTADQLAGRGLWLVNEVCNLVQLRSSDAGTVVRLHMYVR